MSAASAPPPPPRDAGDPAPAAALYLERGSRAYWRASLALLFAGYATFSLLYCVQPLLPEFTHAFGVSPAVSALAVSVSTAALAIAIFIAGFVSESWSRHRLMTLSLLASSVLTVIAALLPDWHALLFVRALAGFALGGVPAVAMAYLAEEVHPKGLGLAMGLYVGGTAIGGMAGRVVSGVLADLFGWRVAIGGIGMLGLLATLVFRALLPPSRRFQPRRGAGFTQHRRSLAGHLRHRGLPFLFLMGFVLMGSFVTLYNYVGYRLLGAPFRLNQTQIGAIFTVYLTGVIASPGSGKMADAFGRGRVLIASVLLMMAGIALTLSMSLPVIIAGIACLTFGFFSGHSVASGWVGRLAAQAKGQAAALYLLAYYLGSSLIGSYGGHFWTAFGWTGVAGLISGPLLAGLAAAVYLDRRERSAQSAAP
jgi:MFS transporter, YNFM family, putative membrane transport protein